MIDHTEACRPTGNEQAGEPATANRQDGVGGEAKIPYAIIWKDGKELELY